MGDVVNVNFKEFTKWNVDDALKEAKELNLKDVLIIGLDQNDVLCRRSSNMTISFANYLLDITKKDILE